MDDHLPHAGTAAQSSAANASPSPAQAAAPKVQQPKPQQLLSRAGPSSILVSPRQKGNPILNTLRATAWEYSEIPADYVVGATTCCLFLSLKYHRLHPEYIFNRIRDLKGQYNLRVLLTMVDIENHEEPLKELSKTSLVNNVTVMLCWSAQEAGRYLELLKAFENSAPTSIRAQQSTSYSEKLVEFITVPRSINKTDAIGLVSNFGSVRTAINATPEEISLIAGWGDKKVQRWCNAVKEPFRLKKAAARGPSRDDTRGTMSRDISLAEGDVSSTNASKIARGRVDNAMPLAAEMQRTSLSTYGTPDADKWLGRRPVEISDAIEQSIAEDMVTKEADAVTAIHAVEEPAIERISTKTKPAEPDMSEGIMTALSKLRKE